MKRRLLQYKWFYFLYWQWRDLTGWLGDAYKTWRRDHCKHHDMPIGQSFMIPCRKCKALWWRGERVY